MLDKRSISQAVNAIEVPPAIEVSSSISSAENNKKERVKAVFSVLDHVVKIYNSGESYIKRGLTLFGLGSIIAGVSFGASQQVNHTQKTHSQPIHSQATATANQSSTPVVTPTNQTPQIIYVQVPANPNWNSPTPVKTSTSASSVANTKQNQVIAPPPIKNQPKPITVANTKPKPAIAPPPAKTKPKPISVSSVVSDKSDRSQIKSVKAKPKVESAKSNSNNSKSIQKDIQEAKQVIKDVRGVAEELAPLKELLLP